MGLSEELQALRDHSRWVEYQDDLRTGKSKGDSEKAALVRYKDCSACPYRRQMREQERVAFCAACPFDDLPPGPSWRLLFALRCSRFPEALLMASATGLSVHEWGDVMTIKESRRGLFG